MEDLTEACARLGVATETVERTRSDVSLSDREPKQPGSYKRLDQLLEPLATWARADSTGVSPGPCEGSSSAGPPPTDGPSSRHVVIGHCDTTIRVMCALPRLDKGWREARGVA